jgi:LysR family glycine cleavage system transcriptional activator
MTPVPTLRFDTHLSALSAAKTGLGVFLASLPLCRDMLDTGALVRLGTRSLSHHESYWLLADRKALSQRQWRGLADAIEGA